MKKVLSLMIITILVVSMSFSANAAVPETPVQPLWETMASVDVGLKFSGTTGTANGSAVRVYGTTTAIEGVLTVYEVDGDDWIYVDSVDGYSTRTLLLNLDFDASSGTEYVAVFEVTGYSDTDSESHTATKYKTCP